MSCGPLFLFKSHYKTFLPFIPTPGSLLRPSLDALHRLWVQKDAKEKEFVDADYLWTVGLARSRKSFSNTAT